MSERIFNFSAGPGVVPEPVLRQAQQDLWNIYDSGIGILEHSHRGKIFDRVVEEAEADCRRVGNIPDNYKVLFVQGGASSQCFMVPANYLPQDRTADYFNTGKWAKDSIDEAHLYGKVHICGSSEDKKHSYIPSPEETEYSDNPVYVHFTSNNTIFGTEFQTEPTPPDGAFLVCDASSNIFSKPIDVTKYGLIYAGGQKNLGPAGTVLVIVREDLLERQARDLPTMLRYSVHAEKGSRYNTPPTFGIYLMGQVFKWILEQGGTEKIQKYNQDKAKVIYDFLESSRFFTPLVRPDSRSMMNITFRTPSPEIDKVFVDEAAKEGLDGLAGHRSAGGMRASIYNAFPKAGCEAIVQFMKDFESRHG